MECTQRDNESRRAATDCCSGGGEVRRSLLGLLRGEARGYGVVAGFGTQRAELSAACRSGSAVCRELVAANGCEDPDAHMVVGGESRRGVLASPVQSGNAAGQAQKQTVGLLARHAAVESAGERASPACAAGQCGARWRDVLGCAWGYAAVFGGPAGCAGGVSGCADYPCVHAPEPR